jgi:phosphatidylglycerol lysyltransferase
VAHEWVIDDAERGKVVRRGHDRVVNESEQVTSEGSARAPSAQARLSVVLRHGRSATAFRALGSDLAAWMPDSDALVAYAAVSGAAVAAGEPVAASSALVSVAEAFLDAQRAVRRRVSFFGTEGRLASSPRLHRRLIGEQPVWDPRRWAEGLRDHRSLREQLRRARAKAVVVERLTPRAVDDPAMQAAVAQLQTRWHATRSMPAMGFLVRQALADGAAYRQTWIARQGASLVGVLSLAPLPARGGWLFEHLLRDPDAPNGTAELLVDAAMRALANDGVTWATLGLAPLHGPVDATLARIRTLSRPAFNFAGLSAFKRKLRPHAWEPIYLAWPRDESGWRAMRDGLRAFAGGSFLRFGARAVWRGPLPLLHALEWLLVPWTMLLALAPTTPWFPSRVVQGSWLAFNSVLWVTLSWFRRTSLEHGAEARRSAAHLAVGLALAVSIDAVLTASEALVHTAPWHHGVLGRVVTLVACVGPAAAAAMLWGAARRARILVGTLAQLDRR